MSLALIIFYRISVILAEASSGSSDLTVILFYTYNMESQSGRKDNPLKNECVSYSLDDLSAFIEHQANLDESLHELAVMASDILKTQNCSIMLLKEEEETGEATLRVFAHSGFLPDVAHQEAVKVKEGISGYVVASGQPLFVENIDKSEFSSIKRGRYKSAGFVAVPIIINEKVIGVINANTPVDRANIDKRDLELLKIIALLIGKSVQIIQLQGLLKSRYIQYALVQEKSADAVKIPVSAQQSPERIAKILAKTFYAEMSRAGFGSDHMLTAATEIISLLGDTLKKHSDRLKRE